MRRWVFGSAMLAALAGVSTPSLAGGHGFVMHGGGGPRMGHAMPPVAGTWHVRDGRSFITGAGRGGFAAGAGSTGWRGGYRGYGHVNTAFGGYGAPRRSIFGHTATAANGLLHARYGYAGRRLALRYGGYPRVLGGYGGGYGGYGGDYGTGGGAYPVGGYGAAPLASQYAEPPLGGEGYYGDSGQTGERSVAGVGGPQVIVVNNNYGAGCHCGSGRWASPIVYRYGVGTYY